MKRSSPLRNRLLVACIGGAISVALLATAESTARRMTADAVKAKGLTLVKTLDADLDGDGRRELVGVATGDKGIQLVLIGENAEGAVVTDVAPPALGKELAKVEAKKLVPPTGSEQVVLEMYDETPDEKVKRMRVYGATQLPDGKVTRLSFKELFTSKIERSKSADERPEWERDKSIVVYGNARAGWYFDDADGDGIFEIVVRKKPMVLSIPGGDGEVKVMTGVREVRFIFNPATQRFEEGHEQLNDFLPAYPIKAVEASSVFVEPKVYKDLRAQALSAALEKATDDKGKSEVKDDIEVDLHSFIKQGADQDLATAWIEGDGGNDPAEKKGKKDGDGKGEWLEVQLDEAQPIHMVRVVGGCVATPKSFRSSNVPETFDVQLDGGNAVTVNRRVPGVFPSGMVAFTDDLVRLKDRPYAKQTLVFFDGKASAQKVRITLGKAIKLGKGNRTCISEVSVH